MTDFQNLRQKFENSGEGHVVINVKKENEEASGRKDSRRISLTTLDWLSGKVESLRRKFSATNIEQTDKDALKKRMMRKINNNGTRRISESDGDLVEMCKKYQTCSTNKYTWIVDAFESIVLQYGELVQANQIEIHRGVLEGDNEPPRGLLLLPLSSATGQALLDFSEMGGYSLGRGSRVAKMATRALSRTHCMIYLENNCVYIKDCDSKTGTFVNGKLLGSSSPTALENFDIIQMGYGQNFEDYIQSMVIFLDNWNAKEFASIIQQLTPPKMYSRTFSNSVSDLKLAAIESEQQQQKPSPVTMTSPLVSSPKMTQITGQSNFAKMKSSAPVEVESETDEEETIVFERPQPIEAPVVPQRREIQVEREKKQVQLKVEEEKEVREVQPFKVHYHKRGESESVKSIQPVEYEIPQVEYAKTEFPSPRKVENTKVELSSPYKVETKKIEPLSPINATASSRIEASLMQNSPIHSVLEDAPLSSSPRPPIPKPRRLKKGLSKSAECLVEVELEEIVEEVEQRKKQAPAMQKRTTTTARMPIESALAARRSSVTQQPVVNVAIPEFLKSENLKIPVTSPAQDLLQYAKLMLAGQSIKRKLNLPVNKKRKERVDRFRSEAQFTTIVQGADMKRFECIVDFGSATSDISDGLCESQLGKKESIQTAFDNFRMTWVVESLNKTSGNKLILQSSDGMRNNYALTVEGRSVDKSFKIGQVEMSKNYMKVSFKIDDAIYKGITGTEIDAKNSLPIKALDQLTYFYPHLEVPSVVIQGPADSPVDKVTINLVSSKQNIPVGKIVFEGQKISWNKRQMFYAVDLDASRVEIDSLLCDTIQSAALLYCLRYHID